MRKFIAAAAIATAAAATSACGHVDNEDGPSVSRNFAVGNFQQIEVAGPYDVDVRTGANASVSAQGSQKLLDRTIVEVQGDKLVIHPQEHHNFFNFSFGSHGNAHFAVTVPQLTGATIAGSGGIKVNHVQGAVFEGTVAGSGGLNVDSVDVQSLKLSIGGSGSAKAAAGKATSADYSSAGLATSKRAQFRPSRRKFRSRAPEASPLTRPARPTSASWGQAMSPSPAVQNAR